MSALILVHRDADGRTVTVPFACHDGQLLMAIEGIADYIVGAGLSDSLWEAVATDRLRVILEQREELRELRQAMRSVPIRELAGVGA